VFDVRLIKLNGNYGLLFKGRNDESHLIKLLLIIFLKSHYFSISLQSMRLWLIMYTTQLMLTYVRSVSAVNSISLMA